MDYLLEDILLRENMQKIKSLSFVYPAYNDSQSLPELIKKTYQVAKKITKNFEVIIVNDGSTDNTKKVLKDLQKKFSKLRVIHHGKNQGYGKAISTGFSHATHEWVFYTDGDGQYDPSELLLLVKKLKSGVDVVNGYKIAREDMMIRRILGKLYNFVLHKLYPVPISDIDCDFRLIRRSVLNKISLTKTSAAFCLELVLKLKDIGCRFTEVGVHHHSRKFGRSQFFKPSHIIKTLHENIIFFIYSKTKQMQNV